MITTAFLTLFFTIGAFAAPSNTFNKRCGGKTCDTSNARVLEPAGITWTPAPEGNPSFVTLGMGYQNYTCKDGVYATAGAVAAIYDLACISQSEVELYKIIPDVVWSSETNNFSTVVDNLRLTQISDHYFIASESGSLSPVWDFRPYAAPNQPNAFVVASRISNFPTPNGNLTTDIDWLQLGSVDGTAASTVFRTETRGGKPPSSCQPDKPTIEIPYVSLYHFYGGNVTLSGNSS